MIHAILQTFCYLVNNLKSFTQKYLSFFNQTPNSYIQKYFYTFFF